MSKSFELSVFQCLHLKNEGGSVQVPMEPRGPEEAHSPSFPGLIILTEA